MKLCSLARALTNAQIQDFFRGGGVVGVETHITCDIPGGPDPLSHLWIRTWVNVKVPDVTTKTCWRLKGIQNIYLLTYIISLHLFYYPPTKSEGQSLCVHPTILILVSIFVQS